MTAVDSALLEKLRQEYESVSAAANQTRLALAQRLGDKIEEQGVRLASPVESRVKTWESVAEKLDRTKLRLGSVLELQDLVGVRFVVLLRPEVIRLCTVIAQEFRSTRQSNPLDRLGDDAFGYSSTHIVVDLPNESVPPHVEVQVRTLAEHLWAIASHRLRYKRTNVPRELTRAMGRAAAALEMVDAELERAARQVQQFSKRDRGESADDRDSRDEDVLGVIPVMQLVDEAWPDRRMDEERDYFALMTELLNLEISTVEQLRRFLTDSRQEVIEEEDKVLDKMVKDKRLLPAKAAFLRRSGELFTQVGAVRTALLLKYGDRFRACGWSGEDVRREFYGGRKPSRGPAS